MLKKVENEIFTYCFRFDCKDNYIKEFATSEFLNIAKNYK